MTFACSLFGVPVESGTRQAGCLMGPDAYRSAGLKTTLEGLGLKVQDHGNLEPRLCHEAHHPNDSIHGLGDTIAWSDSLKDMAYTSMQAGDFPIFLGGDHSLSIGTVPGVSRHAEKTGRPQFVLWLDAHPDIHTLRTTQSGNLHGTPVAYFTGLPDFKGVFPTLDHPVQARNICMMGIRSVDPAEKEHLSSSEIAVHDMRAIDEFGIVRPLRAFLERVKNENGALHLSLDVDFLDPQIAPAVGTTVPGGATFREAHLIMELLYESGLVTSLDLVELNPYLDERGRTARLMVDLCASLMGRSVLEYPTQSF